MRSRFFKRPFASSKGGDDRPAVLIEADDLTLVLETLERARLRVLVA